MVSGDDGELLGARVVGGHRPGDDCDEREDRLALAALLHSVPNDMWSTLARKKMVREAWEAVKTVRVGM
jgi:hypothetical protein